jgi:hypothetical protein
MRDWKQWYVNLNKNRIKLIARFVKYWIAITTATNIIILIFIIAISFVLVVLTAVIITILQFLLYFSVVFLFLHIVSFLMFSCNWVEFCRW